MIKNRSIINNNNNNTIIPSGINEWTTTTSNEFEQESYLHSYVQETDTGTDTGTGTSSTTSQSGVYAEWEQSSNNKNNNNNINGNNEGTNINNYNNMKTEVIVREDLNVRTGGAGGDVFVPSISASSSGFSTINNNNNNQTIPPAFTTLQDQLHPVIIVRAEEVLLVVLVLMIWVAAIALFFNRWGKIRMLEPYQPKFEQQAHRPSCPMGGAVDSAVNTGCSISDLRKQRMSFSKFNVNCLGDPLYTGLISPHRPTTQRLRQNSVFVGSPTLTFLNPPPRRVKSATDIHHLIIGGSSSTPAATQHYLTNSARLPRKSLSGFNSLGLGHLETSSSSKEFILKDRRPSITIERPPAQLTTSSSMISSSAGGTPSSTATTTTARRRPSTYHEFSCYFPIPRRRPSCFSDYKPTIAYGRVSKFKSFDQPSCSWERSDRRLSTAFERSPTNVMNKRSRPSISLERPISWDRRPSVTIEPPPPPSSIINNEHNGSNAVTPLTTKTNDVDEQKPKLQKQTTINFENINPPLNKNSISLDQATSPTTVVHMSYERRPSFTLEHQGNAAPSCVGAGAQLSTDANGKHRLSVSLDQAASKWIGNTPTFMIERATPLSPHPPTNILSSSIELQLFETETESKQITNV